MPQKLLIVLCIILLLFVFPPKIHAVAQANGTGAAVCYYYTPMFAENDSLEWQARAVTGLAGSSEEAQMRSVFTALLDDRDCLAFPNGVRLLSLSYYQGLLVVNVSGAMEAYGGAAQEALVCQTLYRNASVFPQVQRLTLLIDGEAKPLPEGTLIENHPLYCAPGLLPLCNDSE